MIHVGFPLYDSTGRYSKYEAVALLSLLSNTSEELTVHIIHDDSVSDITKDKFRLICNRFNQEIFFYEVLAEDFIVLTNMVRGYTIGTLFRLKIPELLDENISKVIYLDADILFNIDAKRLWDTDISRYYVAACHDEGLTDFYKNMADGLVPAKKYFNAGVTIFNLEKIRKDFNLFTDCINFLINHPKCDLVDQDAINYHFMDNVLYLDKKYNMFTRNKRGLNLPLEEGIYHFSDDYCNPIALEPFDKLFCHYLFMLNDEEWLTDYYLNYLQDTHKQELIFQAFIRRVLGKYKKKVYWGGNSIYFSAVADVVTPDVKNDYIVDSNASIQGSHVHAMIVKSPQQLFNDNKDDCIIIVVSKGAYSAIKSDLESHGFVENKDFFDGLFLLSQSKGKRMAAY